MDAERSAETLELRLHDPDAVLSPLLSLEDAARVLGYSPSGLRKIVRRSREGKPGPTIQFFQIGNGPIRFRPEWIDAFIAANTITPKASIPFNRAIVKQSEGEPRHWRRPA